MKMSTLCTELENTYHKHFPDSRIIVEFSTKFYSSIYIRCFLAGSKEELSGGYWDNDMFHIVLYIESERGEFAKDITADSECPNPLVMESKDKSYFIKPENRMFAYGSRKISYRKVTGNAEKIIQTFEVFCTRLVASLKEDYQAENIHDGHRVLVASKLSL